MELLRLCFYFGLVKSHHHSHSYSYVQKAVVNLYGSTVKVIFFVNLGTESCKPVPVPTGLKGRSVNNFSGKGKPGGVYWSAWDWVLEFEFGPLLLRPAEAC